MHPFLLNYNFLLTICELFLPFLNVIFIASQCAHFTIHDNVVTPGAVIYHLIMVLVLSTFELTIVVTNFYNNLSSAELTTKSIELLSNRHLSRQPDPPSFLSPAQ